MSGSKTILVVEDDIDGKQAVCTILESLGYKHLSFSSAKEALAGIKGHNIDLALLDIMMPEMNGYDLLTEMRKFPEYKALPVIMVTARDDDSDILEGYQYGADYYITKPFNAKQLQYGINLFLD